MKESIFRLLDHYLTVEFIALMWYLWYIFKVLLAFEENKVPLFPNPFLTIITVVSIVILTIISHNIQEKRIGTRWLIARMLLGIAPPLLGFLIVYRKIKDIRNQGYEFWDYINFIPIAFIMLLLSIYYLSAAVILIAFDPIPFHTLYLSSILIFWSMFGFTLGSRMSLENEIWSYPIFQFLKMIIMDINRRRMLICALTILLLILSLLKVSYNPLSIPY